MNTLKKPCLFCIPFEGKWIIYRPLLHAAFIGNHTMAELTEHCLRYPDSEVPQEHVEACGFLKDIGFLEPDPPPPAQTDFKFSPDAAVLLLTNRCNLRCTYCYAEAGDKALEDMPLELALRAIDIAAENAKNNDRSFFQLVFHGGGEPPQHWDVFRKAVDYAESKSHKCSISMSSNGVWSKEQRAFILEHLNGVSLSFDGTREVQDAQRPTAEGGSSFKAVMTSINKMDENKFPYNIRMTITNSFLEKLPECIQFFCEETGCRNFQIEPAFGSGREGWVNPTPEIADRFISAFAAAMDVAESYQSDLTYSGARPWMTVCSFCSAAESALVLRPDAGIVACYEVTDASHLLADVFTIGRLGPNGMIIDEGARENLNLMRQERLALCKDCFCVWHCGGDCSSRCFSPGGKGHLRFEERCRINRELSKELLARYIERSGVVWRSRIEVTDENSDFPGEPAVDKQRRKNDETSRNTEQH